MPFTKFAPADARPVIEEWRTLVGALMDDVSRWATGQGWSVERADTEIAEEVFPAPYTVPTVRITTPTGGEVHLEPVARVVVFAKGRVDMYAYPSYVRVMLLHEADQPGWSVIMEGGIDWPEPWGEAAFVHLVNALTRRR